MDEEFFQPLLNVEYGDEAEFNGFIRKHFICVLTGVFLYLFSFYIVRCFITRNDNDELYTGDEDFLVYRVSVWMCSASLAVAIGADVLLPFSMVGREIVYLYPNNFYTNWLNESLIVSMWNYVFFLSNVSLFVFLPFSYFFIESQGLSFQRRPHRPFLARVYETMLVCALVTLILIGIVDVVYSLLIQHSLLSFSLFYFASLSTPLLYSFASSLGVFLLLLSTPIGFVRMFELFSHSLHDRVEEFGSGGVKDGQMSDGNEELIILTSVERLQAKSLERSQRQMQMGCNDSSSLSSSSSSSTALANGHANGGGPPKLSWQNDGASLFLWLFDFATVPSSAAAGQRWASERRRRRHRWLDGPWERLRPTLDRCRTMWHLLKHPVMMLVLIFFLSLAVAMVAINTMRLLFGFRGLPDYVQCVEVNSRHTFGIIGVLVEIAVILYIILASFVGIYSLPIIRRIRPRYGRTSMTGIILNCGIVLMLSSALPVLARILGLTSFDLLGAYGRIEWISNFMLVISYNVLFVGSSIFCLANKFTLPIRREVIRRFVALCDRRVPPQWDAESAASSSWRSPAKPLLSPRISTVFNEPPLFVGGPSMSDGGGDAAASKKLN